ncbi:hypothetical protein ACFL6U_16375 [Planctomycetota bacterium]
MLVELQLLTGLGILALGWYAIFMIVMLPLLAIAWTAYTLWNRKMDVLEQEERKHGSTRMQKNRGEVSDWAQQMKEFKKPERKPPKPRSPH